MLALLRPVLDLLGHGVQAAFGPAFDDDAHRVDRRGRLGLGLHLGLRLWPRRRALQHRAQDAVGAVGGQTLQARVPGLQVEVLEVVVRVVGRHVDGLEMAVST